jgi:class 3 adenylate cyclase
MEQRFCAKCGRVLTLACSSCSTEAQSDQSFCGRCGKPLTDGKMAEPQTPRPVALPESIAQGRYVVERFLGEGGRKRVYLAHDQRLDRDVAVAIIKTEGLDADGLARVRREAQAIARLGDHPHIVTIHDIGQENGQTYIVSQYMSGGELGAKLRAAVGQRLSVPEAVRIASQVRMALEHSHNKGIIHRDLKPANIWLTEEGTAKLGDFGLAVALDKSRLTAEGMMVGTVAYMPPEQALGREPDVRSDLYSLGCVMYEMLTGRPPFLGDNSVTIISQHINTAPVAPSWHNPETPKTLETLIMRLLAKNPDDRPESAAAITGLNAISQAAPALRERIAEEATTNPLDRLAGGVFVGREKEMEELQSGLEDALSGRGRLLMLVGEPGIGKTRTCEALATYAGLRGVQVVWGRCYEGEGAPAYWPWVQAIRSYVHASDPRELAAAMGSGAADIAQVVPEVNERLPGLLVPPALEPEQERFRLFDSITTFLKNASMRKPMVLVLDDLHWGDKPSLLMLQFLARQLRGSRLLVLATYRDVELRRVHPLSQTLGELGREGLSQRIMLRGLTEHDVARFIEITSGVEPSTELVKAVYRGTEGNPFFVNEIVRLLVADGRLEEANATAHWSVTIPQSVREVVGRRLDHLSETCNDVLTVASVIGREFDLAVLRRISELPGERLMEDLDEAVAARVISEVPMRRGQYAFTHALIRETLYEELSTPRRVSLHRQTGEALENAPSPDPDVQLPQLAYHFFEAAQGGGVDKAINYAQRDAQRATGLFAHGEAVTQYERVLQLLELRDKVGDVERCEALLALGEAQWRAGETDNSVQTFEAAVEQARKMNDSTLFARGALGVCYRFIIGQTLQPLIRLLQEAVDRLGNPDSVLRIRLLVRLGQEHYFESPERQRVLALEALDVARRVGDPATLSLALSNSIGEPESLEAADERLEAIDEIIRLAEAAKDPVRVQDGRWQRIATLLVLGQADAADREIEVYGEGAEELHLPWMLYLAALLRGMRALRRGRIEEAEKLALLALPLGTRSQNPNAMNLFGPQIAAIRREQGRLGEMAGIILPLVQQYPLIPAWRTAAALLHSELRSEADARGEFEVLAQNDFAVIRRDPNWSAAMAHLSQVCCFLGDAARAATLYDLLLPYHNRCVVIGATVDCYGSTSLLLGRLAGTMGRWEDAERHFEAAVEMNTRIGARWVNWTRYGWAEMLVQRDAPGDSEKAMKLLGQVLDATEGLGMKNLLEQALGLRMKIQGVDTTDLMTSIEAVARSVYAEKPDLRTHSAPDGTITIMFSDIEGSTEQMEQLGDERWMEVLREHNKIVRRNAKENSGFEVKTEGDGFMLAFQSARTALRCAIETQRAFARYNETAEPPVRVRMGLHTGEVIKEGDDFFGKHVNLTARIARQAVGGEILVSSLLKELASGGDVVFGGARDLELKGLAGSHRVFPVVW